MRPSVEPLGPASKLGAVMVYQTGPGCTHSASEWRTSNQDYLENRQGPVKDQYLEGKGLNRGGKKKITPAFEYNARSRAYGGGEVGGRGGGQQQQSNQSSMARGGGGRSILAGIGSSLLKDGAAAAALR